jgi:CDK-activating kinase assembly factor MAT1
LQEDDFPSLRAFNDYLEEFETIVYNLVNDIEVTQTQQLVADFTIRHKDQVSLRHKLSKSWHDPLMFR